MPSFRPPLQLPARPAADVVPQQLRRQPAPRCAAAAAAAGRFGRARVAARVHPPARPPARPPSVDWASQLAALSAARVPRPHAFRWLVVAHYSRVQRSRPRGGGSIGD